jgi:hypothetical protein
LRPGDAFLIQSFNENPQKLIANFWGFESRRFVEKDRDWRLSVSLEARK